MSFQFEKSGMKYSANFTSHILTNISSESRPLTDFPYSTNANKKQLSWIVPDSVLNGVDGHNC